MNILIAIIKLLLGLPDEAPAPPPRRRLRPSPASSRPESAPEARPAGLEDMLRRFFDEAGLDGGEGEDKRPGFPPRPDSGAFGEKPEFSPDFVDSLPPRRPSPAARSALQEQPMARPSALAEPAPALADASPHLARVPAAGVAALYADAADAAVARPKSGGAPEAASALAARLRGNPGAGREAFIYAEIFGRPLADRPGGVG